VRSLRRVRPVRTDAQAARAGALEVLIVVEIVLGLLRR
jgi:hypothetical protein